ncbi:PIN-like domain-containing protein [Flavobacteriaceae bacterium S356]|uniref:PIN-like domain-containing protein n=1 Tax=Asprobacillus argus TaxID=3076534 RepID=A0ABU3LHN9_9FLAO|nr:PIN-like domain-containing protein [Flavobacteriaceae bacterium S356]
MKKTFENYYKIPDSKYDEIWDNAIFVLDTNILLNLFRYPESARNDFLKVLRKIKSSLWIPFIAGLEFYENVESVKNSQLKAYSQISKLLEKTKENEESLVNDFVNDLKKLNLDKRHFEISEQELIESIKKYNSDYLKNLNSIQEKYLFKNQDSSVKTEKIKKENDKLMTSLESILKNKIGQKFKSQEEIEKINTEAKKRYLELIPPGYKDSSKSRDSKKRVLIYDSLKFSRDYCDFYLWKEIIQIAKDSKESEVNLIFITDDVKEDWWRISSGKTTGPRIELIDEIKSSTDNKVKNFLMYNSWRFLEFAISKFDLKIKSDTLPQIKLVQEKLNIKANIGDKFSSILKAYYNYLKNTNLSFGVEKLASNKFVLIDDALDKNYYDARAKYSEKFNINYVVEQILKDDKKGKFDEYHNVYLVIIEFSNQNYLQNKQSYFEITQKLPKKINVISNLAEYDASNDSFIIVA